MVLGQRTDLRASYRRLAEVEAEYDPDNAFHHNKNVRLV
jgi:Berberine and berberine like